MNTLRWLLFLACSAVLADDATQVATLLENIETDRSAPIPFTEKRHSRLLDQPLILTGEITFSDDGVLTKQILQPVSESVTISPDTLELRRKGKTRRLNMERRADMRAFYTGMRALLNGDTTTLFELFMATTSVDGDDWTIELVPISEDLQAFLDRLTVTGRGSKVLTFLTEQPGGDSQELSFTAAAD